MKQFYLLLVAVLFYGSTFAQADEPTQLKHYLGFDAGFSTGYGLSYRYMPNEWGIQVNTFPTASKDEYNISIGATVFRTIYRNRSMQFFVYYGNHLYFDKYSTGYYNNYNGYYTTENDTNSGDNYEVSRTWITGIGPGFEFYFAKRLALNVRFGFAYYDEGNDNDWMVNADGGIGLHFRF
jgi:hypothetical protein